MAQIQLETPFATIKGKISGKPSNGRLTVTRQKRLGTDANGDPVYGPKETYNYHLHQGEWSENAQRNRQLFQTAQKQARAELANEDTRKMWQQRFEQHLQTTNRGTQKRYVTLLGFTVAQLHKQLKDNNQQ